MRILLTLLFAAFAAAAFTVAPAAAQTVHGELRDADRDRPLPGAPLLLVTEDGLAVDSTVTDRAARFRLTAPRPGTYRVYFRMDGWAGVPSEPVHLDTGDDARLTFAVRLVSNAALAQMSDLLGEESRLQESLPEICGEPFRAWEAGLLLGVVRRRATREPVPGATVTAAGAPATDPAADPDSPAAPEDPPARTTLSGGNGVYVLCNVAVGAAVAVTVRAPDGTLEETDVEIRAGTASWYDLPIGPRRR